MNREYINIRLAYETKYWIEELQENKQQELNKRVDNGLITDIEEKLYSEYQLNGVSITLILKVSASSIIEEAFNKTKDYSKEQWEKLNSEILNTEKNINPQKELGTLTPRLYLDKRVIKGLEQYQTKFMTEENVRSLRLSYVIKCVIHAYYLYEMKGGKF